MDLVNWTLLTVTTVGVGSYSHLFSSGTYVSLSVMGDPVYQDYNTDYSVYTIIPAIYKMSAIVTINFDGALNVTNIIPSFLNLNVSWDYSGFSPDSKLIVWTSTDGTNWTQSAITTVGALNSIIQI